MDLPLAHVGHTLALLPLFAPPVVLAVTLAFLTARDRLRGGRETAS
jgi:hypothetical protein